MAAPAAAPAPAREEGVMREIVVSAAIGAGVGVFVWFLMRLSVGFVSLSGTTSLLLLFGAGVASGISASLRLNRSRPDAAAEARFTAVR
jgi:hypothetical protein